MAEVDEPETGDLTQTRKELEEQVPDYLDARQSSENVTVHDMYELLSVLRDGLASRDKAVDYLQQQIELNQRQIEQNKRIIAKRGIVTRLIIAVVAFGVLAVGFDQHTIIRSFDKDMTNVSNDMDIMLLEMIEMRKSIQSMSVDINSMSADFDQVARDVNAISLGVYGMSYDTHRMNRTMDTMTPWTPWK
jgi:uncharacterized protein YoxC